MRKVAVQVVSILTAAGLACPMPAFAAFPALAVQTKKTRLPFNQCVGQTRTAAAQSGLLERANFGDSTAGHTATARARRLERGVLGAQSLQLGFHIVVGHG